MGKSVRDFILLVTVLCLSVGSEAGIFENFINRVIPKKQIQVKDWQLENCGTDHKGLQLQNIQVFNNEKDEILVTGNVYVQTFLSAPVTAKVSMKRRVLGVWIEVPCIKDFGSCIYEDLCNYGYAEDETCPASFVQNHVPCRCPIAKGMYNIPSDVRVSAAGTHWGSIVKGKYWAKVHFISNQSELACYVASFTLKTVKN